MLLIHGSSWRAHFGAISREGLREGSFGRGVAFASLDDAYVAAEAAQVACLRWRAKEGTDETIGEALMAVVDSDALDDLVVSPPGWADPMTTYLAERVQRSDIVCLQRFEVPLPERGSVLEWLLLRGVSGFASWAGVRDASRADTGSRHGSDGRGR